MKSASRVAMIAAISIPMTTWGGRPLTIDDAEPVAAGLAEFELGATYVNSTDADHFDFPVALSIGLFPRVEIAAGFGGQFEEREESHGQTTHVTGIGDLLIGAKWKPIDETDWFPAQAFAPSVKFPTADRSDQLGTGEVDYDLTWIASKRIVSGVNFHVNAGYSWVGDPDNEPLRDLIHYGVAFDAQIIEPLQIVGELYAAKERGGGDTVLHYNAGLRWAPTENLVLDTAGGSAFRGDGPDFFATMGLTWTFGFRKRAD